VDANARHASFKQADMEDVIAQGADLSGTNMILANARRAKLIGADFRFTDAVGIDLERADLRYSDLRNADLTKANITSAKLWGCRIRNTKLPTSVGHLKLLLALSQVFQGFGRKAAKAREARERKRVQQVAELVREREAARKRRAR
jgi:hypothetical protein